MPPVTMTGVSAMASSPSSTLRRVISKKFPVVAKFGAMSREEHDLGRQRDEQDRVAGAQAMDHGVYGRPTLAPSDPTAERVYTLAR